MNFSCNLYLSEIDTTATDLGVHRLRREQLYAKIHEALRSLLLQDGGRGGRVELRRWLFESICSLDVRTSP